MPNALDYSPIQEISQSNSKTTDRLYRIFEDIHDHIYANDGLSSQQVFSEILKILFIKIFDEKNNKKSYFLILKTELDTIVNGDKNPVFLKRISDLSQQAFAFFSDVFDKHEEIDLKVSSLAYAVNKLQQIDLLNSSRDVKGLAFQKFVHSTQRSERGQFFTPEQVIQLCVEILQPSKKDKVLDPTCGSGGFLSEAMKFVYAHSLKEASEEEKKEYVRNNLYGIEINPMVARMAKMRMILEGDGFSNIITADSLSNWENLNDEFNKITGELNQYQNFFDVILTNPPFGSQGKVTNKSILQQYDLGYKWIDEFKTTTLQNGQVPDILFIERCLDFLKDGGRLAIVLPNGDLENSSLKYLRNYIKNVTDILAVIDLPSDTFIPFGAGVKTSILILQKKDKNNLVVNHKVFFGKVRKLGYEGNKNATAVYKKDSNGNYIRNENNELVIDQDISDIVNSYNDLLLNKFTEKDNVFVIDQKQISTRFDLDFYKPSSNVLDKKLIAGGAKRLGELVEIVKEKSKKLRSKNLNVQYIELADINTDYMEISNSSIMSVHELPSRASYELRDGDIITAVAGNSIGTRKHMSALVTKQYSEAICTNGFRILRPININPYYLLSYLKSDIFLQQVSKFRTGAAIPSISDGDLQNILIPLPNKESQEKYAIKVKESINLREKARKLLEDTNISL